MAEGTDTAVVNVPTRLEKGLDCKKVVMLSLDSSQGIIRVIAAVTDCAPNHDGMFEAFAPFNVVHREHGITMQPIVGMGDGLEVKISRHRLIAVDENPDKPVHSKWFDAVSALATPDSAPLISSDSLQ